MKSPQEYRADMERLGLSRIQVRVSTVPEAKQALKELREAQQQLNAWCEFLAHVKS